MNLSEFHGWLDEMDKLKPPGNTVRLHKWMSEQRSARGQPVSDEALRAEALALFRTNRDADHAFEFNAWPEELLIDFADAPTSTVAVLTFAEMTKPLTLRGVRCKSLAFNGNAYLVRLENCRIGNLSLPAMGNYELKDTWVGDFVISWKSIRSLKVEGGGIANINCPIPEGENPFIGSVQFSKVAFARKPSRRLTGPQPYRNMRAHMLRLQNAPMAGLFHSLEQAVERHAEQNPVNRGLSWFYQLLSDYGSSPARPLAWLLVLSILTFSVITIADGVAVSTDQIGWQAELCEPDWGARLKRSALLLGQGTLNPLGIFAAKGLVAAKNGWLAALLLVHGFCGAILVALFILAVRRRFKMS